MQAVVLEIKLKHLQSWNQRRREITDFYNDAFAGVDAIKVPRASSWAEPVYHLYVVEIDDRDGVKQKLNDAGIGAGIHYPKPLHLQQAYDFMDVSAGSFPVSERAADRVLSLPNYPEMTEEMLGIVVEMVIDSV